jgi:microcystin-dependent protein
MSIYRTKSRTPNKSRATNSFVFFQNRLTTFTNPPIRTGDLHIENNETVSGNLDVSGNLTIKGNMTANNFYATGNYYLDNYILIPAGTIIQSAAINIPSGWFDCDGSLLSTTTYADLFNAIMYTYGGSGSNFNIPDIRGRVPIGSGSGTDLTTRSLGSTGGEEEHTLSISEIPSHTHSLTRRPNPDSGAFDTDSLRSLESSAATTDRTKDDGSLDTFNTYNTGGGDSHNNMQPYIVLRYLIKY